MSRPSVTVDVMNSAVFHINEALKADNNYADLSDQLGVFRHSEYCSSVNYKCCWITLITVSDIQHKLTWQQCHKFHVNCHFSGESELHGWCLSQLCSYTCSGREPLEIPDTLQSFTLFVAGHIHLLSASQHCKSIKGNWKHWPQPRIVTHCITVVTHCWTPTGLSITVCFLVLVSWGIWGHAWFDDHSQKEWMDWSGFWHGDFCTSPTLCFKEI